MKHVREVQPTPTDAELVRQARARVRARRPRRELSDPMRMAIACAAGVLLVAVSFILKRYGVVATLTALGGVLLIVGSALVLGAVVFADLFEFAPPRKLHRPDDRSLAPRGGGLDRSSLQSASRSRSEERAVPLGARRTA
jgi:hypothetical protein